MLRWRREETPAVTMQTMLGMAGRAGTRGRAGRGTSSTVLPQVRWARPSPRDLLPPARTTLSAPQLRLLRSSPPLSATLRIRPSPRLPTLLHPLLRAALPPFHPANLDANDQPLRFHPALPRPPSLSNPRRLRTSTVRPRKAGWASVRADQQATPSCRVTRAGRRGDGVRLERLS